MLVSLHLRPHLAGAQRGGPACLGVIHPRGTRAAAELGPLLRVSCRWSSALTRADTMSVYRPDIGFWNLEQRGSRVEP